MCAASWCDCSTPCPARAGSLAIPVGEGMEVVYSPVLELTDQLDRNCCAC